MTVVVVMVDDWGGGSDTSLDSCVMCIETPGWLFEFRQELGNRRFQSFTKKKYMYFTIMDKQRFRKTISVLYEYG